MRRPLLLAVVLLGPLAACSSGGGVPTAAGAPTSPEAATTAAVPPLPTLSPSPAGATGAATSRSPGAGPAPTARPRRTTATSSPSATPRPDATPRPSPTSTPLPSGSTFGVAEVTGDRFAPSSVTLHVGDSVLVTDQDPSVPHTFTIGALHVDSGGMSDGQTFRYRFRTPGRFTFVCTYHQSLGMTGTMTVLS